MSNYEQMQTNGRMPQPTKERNQSKLSLESCTDEGWTPELLDWFIAAISVALEDENNRSLIQKMRNVSDR